MKILITGGAGFIASHVADAYLAQGHRVTVLDNLSTGKRENLPQKAEFVHMDLTDPGLDRLVAGGGFDLVNHHAAQVSVPFSAAEPLADLEANARGTLRLLLAAAAAGVKRFVFISTGGAIYGEQEALPTPETVVPRPMSPYAVHKLTGESYLPFFRETAGLETVVLRYANVYGPRQVPHAEAGVVAIFTERLAGGRQCAVYRPEDMPGGMIRDYVFVGDVVRANLAALTAPSGGIYNIGTGRGTDTLELLRAVAAAAGVETEPVFGPPRPGEVRRSVLDVGLAARELGWRAEVDLMEGCRRTVQWFHAGAAR